MKTPVAKAEMLIHKSASEVFEAFVNPEITTHFWFTKSSGRLEQGKEAEWAWEMYGFSKKVNVKALIPNRSILIDWYTGNVPLEVEWTFIPYRDNSTFVSIVNRGFQGNEDEVVAQAINSTEGFTLVLAGLKALLEHKVKLNLVYDRFPSGL